MGLTVTTAVLSTSEFSHRCIAEALRLLKPTLHFTLKRTVGRPARLSCLAYAARPLLWGGWCVSQGAAMDGWGAGTGAGSIAT